MRNAVAQLDDASAFDEPQRRPASARKKSGGKRKAARRAGKGKGRLVHYVAIGLSASVAIGIMVNALVLQHSRHPAPLFGKAIQLGEAAPPQLGAPAATPAPVGSGPSAIPPASAPAPIPQPVHRAATETPASVGKAKQDDAIARLLRTSAAPGADKARDNAKTVLATQHALMKLGFVVKPSGTFGPVTKTAIEAFERDQHIPVKGEMSRKLLKQLSAESGVAID